MRVVHIKDQGRRGFTLVELLVVIAIIGVLVSLLLAAVMKALSKAEESKTRSDLSQLAQAVSAWQVKFETKEPFPSRIKLCEFYKDYDLTKPLDIDSVAFLQRVWPRITTKDPSGNTVWNTDPSKGYWIDWNGDKVAQSGANDGFILQGQECLVFFLGGIPTGQGGNVPGCTGFSTNPSNPAAHISPGGGSIIPPFYSFDSSRLVIIAPSKYFFSYKDAYEKAPYAYFSSYKTMNGYNRYGYGLANSDCAALSLCPYAEAQSNGAARYLNPNTFQIISAGVDGKFGAGSTAPTSSGPFFVKGVPMYGFGKDGYDDMSNFHDKFLGIPNE
jgi:general secretion pathway protein G